MPVLMSSPTSGLPTTADFTHWPLDVGITTPWIGLDLLADQSQAVLAYAQLEYGRFAIAAATKLLEFPSIAYTLERSLSDEPADT